MGEVERMGSGCDGEESGDGICGRNVGAVCVERESGCGLEVGVDREVGV